MTASPTWSAKDRAVARHGDGADAASDAAVAELERVVRNFGFKAVEIGTSIEGAQLAEERFGLSCGGPPN